MPESPATGPAPESNSPDCFHCGLEIPPGTELSVRIEDIDRPMCCPGCQAVAQAIVDNGLTDYYRHRTADAPSGQGLVPRELQNPAVFDLPEVQQTFVAGDEAGHRSASLILEGITCAACIWLNEKHLRQQPGVISADINYATQRARVVWDPAQIRLSQIIESIQAIGYKAHPYDPGRRQQILDEERRTLIKRFGVAAALGMQVMILSVGMYAGDFFGMEDNFRELFRRLALLLTLPILLYSAKPFFAGALTDLRHRRVGMDIPVALGMTVAFAASTLATIRGSGEVYFDSVAMFAFFLLGTRLLEMGARRKAAVAADNLAQATPQAGNRLDDRDEATLVAARELAPGDRVMVHPGEAVPADGIIESGPTALDESMLTGESLPVSRGPGEKVLGGSINREQATVVRITHVAQDTVLSSVQRLYEQGQQEKPPISRLADRIAGWFVLLVLGVALATAAYWLLRDDPHWLEITLSVLVVACPCALSLATPAAMSAAVSRLVQQGVLVTRGTAIEGFASLDDIAFDKTGTLTAGRMHLDSVEPQADVPPEQLLGIAAALEKHSAHPIARAVLAAADEVPVASQVQFHQGLGLQGEVDGTRYHLGSAEYIASKLGDTVHATTPPIDDDGASRVMLANGKQLLGTLVLRDSLRGDAAPTLRALQAEGLQAHLVSGDAASAVHHTADQLGMTSRYAALLPADKMRLISDWQQAGRRVAMVGDGINDAPVLARADVSVAVSGASPMAMQNADVVLLSNRLGSIVLLRRQSRRTLRIIRQNLAWAAGYNFSALPFAAMGWIPPWLAAIGMSLSSLLVVGNALRLTRTKED